MDTNTSGVKVEISADTSKLAAGLNQAKTQFAQFTQGLNQGLASSEEAMGSATVTTDKLAESTKNLGEKMGETGSRRELRESMNLVRAGMEGTAGATDALRAILVTFASSMGGPTLVAITAVIAVLGTLYEVTKNYLEEQRLLTDQSAQLNMHPENIEAMTTAMRALAFQIAGAQDGFGHMSQAKIDLMKSMGLDPASAADAVKAIVMVENSADDLATKMHNFAVLSGETDPAKIAAGWDAAMQENKKSSKGWFDTWMGYIAAGELAQAGLYDDADKAMPKNKGDANKEGVTTGGNFGKAKTQQQLDDEKAFQDEHLKLVKEGTQAEIEANDTAAQKIIADAKLANDQRLKDTADYIEKHTELTQSQKNDLNSTTASTNATVMGAAQIRAAKITQEQQLAQESEFQSEMSALRKAGADSAIGVEQTAGEKIIAEGQAKIDALAQQYLKDVSNLQKALAAKKISQDTYNKETSALGSAFGSSVAQISDNSQAKAAQEEALQQEKIDDQLQEYLRNSADQTARDLKGIKESETQKIIDQGNLELQAIQARYDKELDLLNQNLAAKKMSEEQYNQDVAAIDDAAEKAKAANAQAVAQKITAANNAPLNSLVDTWSNTSKQMSQFAADTANNISSSLVTMMMTGKMNLASLTEAILADLAKIVIEKQIAGIIGGMMGAPSTGTGVSSVSSTGFAGGGTVQGGVPIPVGERGPELFTPNTAGTITSNSALGGGGMGDVHIMMTNNGTPQKVQSAQPQMSGKDMILQIITDDLRTSGPISTGVQQKFGLKRQAYM